jgi:hypothetical protein
MGGTLTLRCRSDAPVCTISRNRRLIGGSETTGGAGVAILRIIGSDGDPVQLYGCGGHLEFEI